MGKEKTELTKFLVEGLANELKSKLEKVHFIPPNVEKKFPGHLRKKRIFFDIWSQKYGKNSSFAVWEIEVRQTWADNNIRKLKEILDWSWEPKIHTFHVFSPDILKSTKNYCEDEVERLRKKYRNRFLYTPIEIKIPKNRFDKMLEGFKNNKYSAKRSYGKELEKEMRRIANVSVRKLNMMNKS